MDGDVNVIVADGFTGNIALKTAEGLSRFIMGNFKHIFSQNIFEPNESESINRNSNSADILFGIFMICKIMTLPKIWSTVFELRFSK